MKDQNKTKKQLLNELMELRQRIAELETLENEHKGSGVVLEQLAAIVQSSDDAIISKTLEGIILSWNSGAERIYGYSSAEVIGRHISILLPPNRPDEVSQFLGRIGRGERIDHYETVHIRKDSQLILVSLTISPVRDATGKIVSASTIARDITERKRAEGEYRTILRTTMDGFWIADIQGRFLDVNDAYCRLIGYSRGELLTMSISDVEALERPEETAQRIQRIMETDGDRFETRHRCKDGRIIDIEVSVNYTEVGSRRLFVFLRDITERKRAEEALNTEKQRFQTLSEQAPFGMVMIEQNGTFRYINPKFKELFGYDLTDIPDGRTWFRKACPDPIYRHRVIAEWMKDLESFKRGEKRARIFKATCKDGTEKIVNFISVPSLQKDP